MALLKIIVLVMARQPQRKHNIVVLGAGASRGAKLKEGIRCKPPLNNDFFTQLQRISDEKHKDTIQDTIKDINKLFGSNWSFTLEEYFTKIEFFSKVIELTGDTPATKSSELKKARDNLLQALSAVFEESIPDECVYHKSIVDYLKHDDVIISFNYDCLVDEMLKKHGDKKWDPQFGYCFPKDWKITGADKWSPSVSAESTIKLLKLHGSLNWDVNEKTSSIKLKERLYRQHGKVHFTIIPPEWNKGQLETNVFVNVWKQSAYALARAKNIIIIGYSFSNNDQQAQALFRLAVRQALNTVIIVNPDKEARRLTRSALQGGINHETIIIQFDSLEEFSKANIGEFYSLKM